MFQHELDLGPFKSGSVEKWSTAGLVPRRPLNSPFQSVRLYDTSGEKAMFKQLTTSAEWVFVTDALRHRHFFMFLLLALLLLAILPSAEAQDGRCIIYSSGWYLKLSSSGYMKGTHNLYQSSNCAPPSNGSVGFGKHGTVHIYDRQKAISACQQHTGISNMTVRPARLGYSCRPIFEDSGGSSRGSGSGGNDFEYQPPEVHVTKLPLGSVVVNAELGMNSGIIFQRFDHYGVGLQSVVDMGILDVVDVWGQANQKFEVCFPQHGKVVFLDATTSPRSLVHISNFKRDGYSCAEMNRPGTMVLVESAGQSSSTDQAIAQSFIDSTNDPVSTAIDLTRCQVTPQHNLNLRAEPWGEQLAVVRKGTTVSAIARTQSWFKVIFVQTGDEAAGEEDKTEPIEGWIAAWLSDTEGNCAWDSDSYDGPVLATTKFLAHDGIA